MTFSLQPVRVAVGPDEEGLLVFTDGRLAAVLVRLSDQHDGLAGRWFLEHGFGRLDGPEHPHFPDAVAAQAWIAERLVRRSI